MIFPLLLTALGGYLIGSSAKQYSRGGKLPSNVQRFVELQDEVNQQIDEKGEANYELTEELNRIGDSLNSYESELAIEEYMKRREPVKMANGIGNIKFADDGGMMAGGGLIPTNTNRFIYHKSNPIFRERIDKEGLITKRKSETWLSDTPIKDKVIFATNSDNKKDWFDSTYDDDVYKIDTSKSDNTWYKDPNFDWKDSKYIITFTNIPRKAIRLIYKGTGK